MVPEVVDAAMGSALLAASGEFGGLNSAAQQMIRYSVQADPDATLVRRYEEIYAKFREDFAKFYAVEV